MPLVPLEYPGQSPLSPSKRINSSRRQIHPTPPPTPLRIPTSSSAQTPQVGKRKYHCQTCNGENVLEVCINSVSPQLDHVTCTEIILGILQAHGFTLGDFIMTVLDHKMPFNRSTTELLKHFIQGCTKKNCPIDIIHALYCHPYACCRWGETQSCAPNQPNQIHTTPDTEPRRSRTKTQGRPLVSGSTGNRYFFNLLQSNFQPVT